MDTATIPSELVLPEARCRLYKFLSAMLCYPRADVLAELPGRWETLMNAGNLASPRLAACLLHASRFQRFSHGEFESAWLRCFGASPHGSISPHECEYGEKEIFQIASDLADINAFYAVFGVRPTGEAHERGDHIAAECEFMAFLCARELIARSEHDNEQAEIVRDAEKNFLQEHLVHWATAFARQLSAADRDGPYGVIATVLEGLMLAECERFGIHTGSVYLPLRQVAPADDSSHCMNCAREDGLPGCASCAVAGEGQEDRES